MVSKKYLDRLFASISGFASVDDFVENVVKKPEHGYRPTVHTLRHPDDTIWLTRKRQLLADTIDCLFASAGDPRRCYRSRNWKSKAPVTLFDKGPCHYARYYRKNPRGGPALFWNNDLKKWIASLEYGTEQVGEHPSLRKAA